MVFYNLKRSETSLHITSIVEYTKIYIYIHLCIWFVLTDGISELRFFTKKVLSWVKQNTELHHKEMFLIYIAMQNLSALQDMRGKTAFLQVHY